MERTSFAAVVLATLLSLAAAPTALARVPADGFADLAEGLTSVAVTISTEQTVSRPLRNGPNLSPDSPLNEFFKEFFGPNSQGPRRQESEGSGFVIDAEGYIVTNNHVIQGAEDITVEFSDGKTYEAVLKGADPEIDIALLKIEPDRKLAVARFGDSDAVRVGDLVLAIGNPLGQGFSVSQGIISALNRDINVGRYDRFLQTDASINRGNSGGPLVNMKGEVIGVNTAIISPTGGSIGIGFASPSSLVVPVVKQLREQGEVRRGRLGVSIQDVDEGIAESLGLGRAYGAMVLSVDEEGPAAAGGVQSGDVITRFNGEEIANGRELQRIVAEAKVGSKAQVEVFRNGAVKSLNVDVALWEGKKAAGAADGTEGESAPGADKPVSEYEALGLAFAEIDDAARKKHRLDDALTGALIVSVDQTSSAYEKGLRPGDVLVEVQQSPVAGPDEAVERIEDARALDRSAVLLMVVSGATRRYVAVDFTR